MTEQHNFLQGVLAEESAKYLVHSRHEISQILHTVMHKKGMITGYFNQGQSFFLSIILKVDLDSGYMLLDCGPDPETNRRALASTRFIFVTNQNHIKIQFSTPALEQIEFEGQPAFRTQLPSSLLKLQRREYYRMVVPIRAPLFCIVPDLDGERLETDVADISLGGIAISGLPETVSLAEGLMLPDCRIALPEEGTVETTLEIRNIRKTSRRSAQKFLHVGCAYADIQAAHRAMIQRYITRIDREQRAQDRDR